MTAIGSSVAPASPGLPIAAFSNGTPPGSTIPEEHDIVGGVEDLRKQMGIDSAFTASAMVWDLARPVGDAGCRRFQRRRDLSDQR
ncbi:hypothetical protein [Nocardia sp. CC201C]|uniref:hypothetical protein n=1 Tax=Nocardia sp. CC201C TaxID=3044575 RepID=UPI0024A9C98B|nr:hypothetical protein [Nocardia sp. CC201C]